MKKSNRQDTPIFQIAAWLGNLMFLDLLFLVCCIPVVTIGASATALYRMIYRMQEEKACGAKEFFRAFAADFKKSTALWLLWMLAGGVLAGLYSMLLCVSSQVLQMVLLAPFCVLFLLVTFTGLYLFPLTAYFENSVSETLRNAFLMSLGHLPRTIPAMVLLFLPAAAAILSPGWFIRLSVLWGMLGTGLVAYGIASLLKPVFESYS